MNKDFTEMNNANKFYQINVNIGLGILLFIILFSLVVLPESNILKIHTNRWDMDMIFLHQL